MDYECFLGQPRAQSRAEWDRFANAGDCTFACVVGGPVASDGAVELEVPARVPVEDRDPAADRAVAAARSRRDVAVGLGVRAGGQVLS